MCGRFELALVSLRLDVSNCQCVMLPTRQKQSLPNRLRFEMHRVHYLAIHRGRKVAHSSSIVLRPPIVAPQPRPRQRIFYGCPERKTRNLWSRRVMLLTCLFLFQVS
jgi:hypothetical protein